jgi:hypothetical protein
VVVEGDVSMDNGNRLTIVSIGVRPKQISDPGFPPIGAKAQYGLARENQFTLEIVDAGPTVFEIHGTFHRGEEFDKVIDEFLRVIKLPSTKPGDWFLIEIEGD